MKTQKKKTFNLNKLQIATLEQTDLIKGGTKGQAISNEAEADCRG